MLFNSSDVGSRQAKSVRTKWVVVAVCLCLVVCGVVLFRGASAQAGPVLRWSSEWEAGDYFQDCGRTAGAVGAVHTMYAPEAFPPEERVFSSQRELLESEGAIPEIDSHPLFNCTAYYQADDSLSYVKISWYRRGEMADYSDLMVVAGYQEVERIGDCVSVEVDASGDPVEPRVTVTERDGVRIVAEGAENKEKILTFQNETGWYQISGSFNDSYEPVVALLDWFWEHPLDLGRFPMDAGDNYEVAMLAEHPDAFAQYLPDFTSFGFIETQTVLVLKNGKPASFDGHYVAHVDEATAKAGTYYDVEGHTTVSWYLETEPDYYTIQDCAGDLFELTEIMVTDELSKNGGITFAWDENCVTVSSSDAFEAWTLIESLQSR